MTFDRVAADIPEASPAADLFNTTTELLKGILSGIQALQGINQKPAPSMEDLSPAAGTGNNGRILQEHVRMRITDIVIVYTDAVTFVLKVGSANFLSLPATTAGATGILHLPLALILDRGVSLQLTAGAATWAAYAIGYPE